MKNKVLGLVLGALGIAGGVAVAVTYKKNKAENETEVVENNEEEEK